MAMNRVIEDAGCECTNTHLAVSMKLYVDSWDGLTHTERDGHVPKSCPTKLAIPVQIPKLALEPQVSTSAVSQTTNFMTRLKSFTTEILTCEIRYMH